MKRINRKRLNNKGFTLIELLAVVVILAVVMGIAMTSVLSSMNKARGGSLEDSAIVVAQGFNQKYLESQVGGTPSNVYGDILETGYDFTVTNAYTLDAKLADTFNINTNDYDFADSAKLTITKNVTKQKSSFVYYNANNGKFTVCLFAKKGGSYYVDGYKTADATKVLVNISDSITITADAGTMFACSDGTTSW